MRTVFIGCVEFSERVLRALVASATSELVGVVTKNSSKFNSDFASLEPIAREHGVPCFLDAGNNQKALLAWLGTVSPDIVFCVGWPHLLAPAILSIPRHGVVGYHPADLPRNRGRHPIIWALALGLNETASTFFRMVAEPDAGPLLVKTRISIHAEDDARSLYEKLVAMAQTQVIEVAQGLKSGTLIPMPQDLSQGNLWRKRGKDDGLIDWRMGSTTIVNLVRALARPYVGAHCKHRGMDVKTWRAALGTSAPRNLEPGKVLEVEGSVITVKSGDGSIRILEHEFVELPQVGEYL